VLDASCWIFRPLLLRGLWNVLSFRCPLPSPPSHPCVVTFPCIFPFFPKIVGGFSAAFPTYLISFRLFFFPLRPILLSPFLFFDFLKPSLFPSMFRSPFGHFYTLVPFLSDPLPFGAPIALSFFIWLFTRCT